MKYKLVWKMVDIWKIGVLFFFLKKVFSKYSFKRNVFNSDDVKVKEEKWDYIYFVEGKEFKRFVYFI